MRAVLQPHRPVAGLEEIVLPLEKRASVEINTFWTPWLRQRFS
jgi:hypothetical protein